MSQSWLWGARLLRIVLNESKYSIYRVSRLIFSYRPNARPCSSHKVGPRAKYAFCLENQMKLKWNELFLGMWVEKKWNFRIANIFIVRCREFRVLSFAPNGSRFACFFGAQEFVLPWFSWGSPFGDFDKRWTKVFDFCCVQRGRVSQRKMQMDSGWF